MKSVKLASILLASGMLLGTAHTAVTPAYTAHAADRQMLPKNQVELQTGEFSVNENGIITGIIRKDSDNPAGMESSKLTDLFNGGKLVIPEEYINDAGDTEEIKGIGYSAFNRYNYYDGLGITELEFDAPDNITYIGNNAFNGNAIKGELNLKNVTEIGRHSFKGSALTSVKLPNVETVGENAFHDNDIKGELNLPRVTTIEELAFTGNALTSVKLPEVITIGMSAFLGNELTKLKLEKVTSIGDGSFVSNKLKDIDIPAGAATSDNAFAYQRLEQTETANKQGELSFDDLSKPTLKEDGVEQELSTPSVSLSTMEGGLGRAINNDNVIIDEDNAKLILENKNTSGKVDLQVSFGVMGYSIDPLQLTINANSSSTDGSGNTGGNGSTETDTSETPGTSTPDTSTPDTGNNNETPIVISPDPEVNRPHTVYAKRAMRLHSNVSLTSPTESYKKRSRAKAKSFRVLGVSYDKSGKKRYKVKGGYITASTKYVADSHFRSSKVKQVRVIGNRVNSYKNVKLSKSQKVRSYKKGTKIKVKRIVKHGRATRFQLNNGRYITGNKQLLIMDHSK